MSVSITRETQKLVEEQMKRGITRRGWSLWRAKKLCDPVRLSAICGRNGEDGVEF